MRNSNIHHFVDSDEDSLSFSSTQENINEVGESLNQNTFPLDEQESSEIEQDNENIQNPPVTVLRRSERLAKKGAINCSCVASNVSSDEPLTVEEALLGDQHSKWLQAMNDEINSLVENRTWTRRTYRWEDCCKN